jgi:hypothetical protein
MLAEFLGFAVVGVIGLTSSIEDMVIIYLEVAVGIV